MPDNFSELPTTPCTKCGGTGELLDDVKVGQFMRKVRLSLDLSLREVSYRLRISPSYLSDLELGRRRWHPAITRKYFNAILGS